LDRDSVVAIFDDAFAERYDDQTTGIESLHDALHLGMQVAFARRAGDEPLRVLCVGAGTGSEIVALANNLTDAHFTAVEPAPAMLARCRDKVEEAGLLGRVTLHEGFIETLPSSAGAFDCATCLLVSHFIVGRTERVAFFEAIRRRMRPGGILVSADLSWPSDRPAAREAVMDHWVDLMRRSGREIDRAAYAAKVSQHVGLMTPGAMESVLEDSGFREPVAFYRMSMIGGWFSRA